MTGSVHVALGAAIGRFVRNKPAAFGVGVFSHFVGDVIPHQDVGIIEVPLVFGTLFYVGWRHGWTSSQFLGAFGAMMPDFEHIPAELRKDPRRFEPMEEKLFPTHNGIVPHGKWPLHFNWGVVMQIVLFVGGLYLAGSLSPRDKDTDSQ